MQLFFKMAHDKVLGQAVSHMCGQTSNQIPLHTLVLMQQELDMLYLEGFLEVMRCSLVSGQPVEVYFPGLEETFVGLHCGNSHVKEGPKLAVGCRAFMPWRGLAIQVSGFSEQSLV